MTTAPLRKATSRDEDEILALLDALRQAHHDKDAAAIAAAYTDDAIICDLAPPLFHRGVDVKEKQAWLDSWEGPIDLEPRDFSLTISGDIAYTQGYLRMSGTPKAAGRNSPSSCDPPGCRTPQASLSSRAAMSKPNPATRRRCRTASASAPRPAR